MNRIASGLVFAFATTLVPAQVQNVPHPDPFHITQNVEPCGGLRVILRRATLAGQVVCDNLPMPAFFTFTGDPCRGFYENDPVWLNARAVGATFNQPGATATLSPQATGALLSFDVLVDSPFAIESRLALWLDLDDDREFDDSTERFGLGNPPAAQSRPIRGHVYRHAGSVFVPTPTGGFPHQMRARLTAALLGQGTNLPPAGGATNFGWVLEFAAVVPGGRLPEFQQNTDVSSLAVDGVVGGSFRLATVVQPAPGSITLRVDSSQVGCYWLLNVTTRSILSRTGGAQLTPHGQLLHTDPNDPLLIASFGTGFQPLTLAVPNLPPLQLAAQLVVLTGAHPDGFAASQPVTLTVQ
jgi:hypothetical protein